MTAARLRRVGNQGHLVDPGAVIALYAAPGQAVRLVLEHGVALDVWRPATGEAVTDQDVANVHRALTDRGA